jgi:hypothetical protein
VQEAGEPASDRIHSSDHRLANRDGFVSDLLVDSLDPLARDRIDPYHLAFVLFRSLM